MKRYCIVGKDADSQGLMALFSAITAGIIEAVKEGYTPIVDMQHFNNMYFKDNRVYKDNIWEYFFEQPAGVSLNDIKDEDEVVIKKATTNSPYYFTSYFVPKTLDDKSRHCEYTDEVLKYFKPCKEMQAYLDEEYKKIIGDEKDILGILCRGSDYISHRPHMHPIMPEPEKVIEKAKELFEKFHYKKIWLATEDCRIWEMFKNEFQDKIIDFDQQRFTITRKNELLDTHIKKHKDIKNFGYELGRKYLLSMYILSKCKYIIGTRPAGIVAVYLFSKLFKNQSYVYIYDLGLYGTKYLVEYKNIYERIFSVKNERIESKKRKVLTIAGLKFRSRLVEKDVYEDQ